MSYNFKKQGYSTFEVAQILGCHYKTVLNMIDTGRLEAEVQPKLREGGKRRIRISRQQLINYLCKNKTRFSPELLNAFGVGETVCLVEAQMEKNREEKSFTKGTTKEPCGAWAIPKKESSPEIIKESREKRCSVCVDGRICVANISKDTATKIVEALMTDNIISMDSISIQFTK